MVDDGDGKWPFQLSSKCLIALKASGSPTAASHYPLTAAGLASSPEQSHRRTPQSAAVFIERHFTKPFDRPSRAVLAVLLLSSRRRASASSILPRKCVHPLPAFVSFAINYPVAAVGMKGRNIKLNNVNIYVTSIINVQFPS